MQLYCYINYVHLHTQEINMFIYKQATLNVVFASIYLANELNLFCHVCCVITVATKEFTRISLRVNSLFRLKKMLYKAATLRDC